MTTDTAPALETTSLADDFKCDDCKFKIGAFYAKEECKTCDGSCNYVRWCK